MICLFNMAIFHGYVRFYDDLPINMAIFHGYVIDYRLPEGICGYLWHVPILSVLRVAEFIARRPQAFPLPQMLKHHGSLGI